MWPAYRATAMKGTASARPISPSEERIAGELVDLPADDQALHLDGDGHEEPEPGEKPVIPDLQGGEGVVFQRRIHSRELYPIRRRITIDRVSTIG